MRVHYILDDSAARLPLTIRSADAVQDRSTDLRSASGVHLVELTTQHMQSTSATLLDELTYYFDNDRTTTEGDPYALAHCYAHHTQLEDLWHDIRDRGNDLAAFDEVTGLFPTTFKRELPVTLAFTVVGYQAFGYVRTYKDSEGDEYHGLVVNLAQAQPHLENTVGQFSRSLLTDTIRHGFFNHQVFLLAYGEYCEAVDRIPHRASDRLKDLLLSRGIAWYLSYSHDLALYDDMLALSNDGLTQFVASWNDLIEDARNKRLPYHLFDEWMMPQDTLHPHEQGIGIVGYHIARTIADRYGIQALREAIRRGPDHFIQLYNALGQHTVMA
jgi:hypothetical protein